MSAFVVGTDHIDAMVSAGLGGRRNMGPLGWYTGGVRHELSELTADRVGAMLLQECINSVSARYPSDGPGELPGPIPTPEPALYSFHDVDGLAAVASLKIIGCYEYQSCEHDGWEDSEARAFCDALRRNLIARLPGYEDAPWEYTRPAGVPKVGRAHWINCAEAEARSSAGEMIQLTPGQCWCGSAMPVRKPAPRRRR